jgi:hypothetical protein
MLKKLLLTSTALIFTAAAALAISGNQIGFPIVGGASYCGSFGNGGVCNQTTPAGPAAVTGNETIIANTNLPNGQNPQTVLMNMADLNALPYLYVASPPSAGSTTLTSTVGQLILDPTTTLASYTVVFPAATTLIDGQKLGICTTQTLSSLTLTAGAGSTISLATTVMNIPVTNGADASCAKWQYVLSATKWFRVQ